MTEQEIINAKKDIDSMSQEDMCRLRRFAPAGHPYFDRNNSEIREYWDNKFESLGGFTPEISKQLGFENA